MISTVSPSTTPIIKLSLETFLDQFMESILSGKYDDFNIMVENLNILKEMHLLQNSLPEFYTICKAHPIHQLFQLEPITHRSFTKPRGYTGDAVLIDYLYRLNSPSPCTSFLGREIYAKILSTAVSQSVRWRAKHLAEKIEHSHQTLNRPINAFAIASGHLRELHFVKDIEAKVSKFYALDQDPLSNAEAKKCLPYDFLDIRAESISAIIKKSFQPQAALDFIYSAGLFDYLNDKLAARLLTTSFDLLAPGGSLLVANFAPGLVEQAYMEAYMDWHLIYRDEEQMSALLKEIGPEEIGNVKMYRDPMEKVVYMEVMKKV